MALVFIKTFKSNMYVKSSNKIILWNVSMKKKKCKHGKSNIFKLCHYFIYYIIQNVCVIKFIN